MQKAKDPGSRATRLGLRAFSVRVVDLGYTGNPMHVFVSLTAPQNLSI